MLIYTTTRGHTTREKYREKENNLEKIKNTKLYWFFKNNLIKDYCKRKILMIYESYIL